jgi:hypothetical protein
MFYWCLEYSYLQSHFHFVAIIKMVKWSQFGEVKQDTGYLPCILEYMWQKYGKKVYFLCLT